jgi:membrane-associated phospholipid phosphatase
VFKPLVVLRNADRFVSYHAYETPRRLGISQPVGIIPRLRLISVVMSYSKRFLLVFIVLLVSCLYFPLNRYLSGGHDLKTSLDAYIPIVPIFAVPYLLFLPFWGAVFFFAAYKMDDSLFRSFIIGSITAILTATLVYMVFPTYMDRRAVFGNGWTSNLLRTIYAHDDAYNAFPSGHVLNTTLIGLFGIRWNRRMSWFWQGMIGLVLLSTLLTGQHHLADLLGGLVLGWAGFQFGLWVENKYSQYQKRNTSTDKTSQLAKKTQFG